MRYTCPNCKRWIKDKFLFGLLHVCEPQPKTQAYQNQILQAQKYWNQDKQVVSERSEESSAKLSEGEGK